MLLLQWDYNRPTPPFRVVTLIIICRQKKVVSAVFFSILALCNTAQYCVFVAEPTECCYHLFVTKRRLPLIFFRWFSKLLIVSCLAMHLIFFAFFAAALHTLCSFPITFRSHPNSFRLAAFDSTILVYLHHVLAPIGVWLLTVWNGWSLGDHGVF